MRRRISIVQLAERREPSGAAKTGRLGPFRYTSIDDFNVVRRFSLSSLQSSSDPELSFPRVRHEPP